MSIVSSSTLESRHFGYEGMPLTGKQKKIIGINLTLAILATLAVAGRFWARKVVNAKLWWDDWTILLAMILCYGSIAHVVVGINLGLGIPFAYAHISDFLKNGLIYFCLYIITLATIKFSVLLLYYRIFKVASFKIAVYVVGSIVAVWATVAFFITLFECTPISDFWSISLTKVPHCIDRLMLFDATAASNTILDILILCLPIKMIMKLQLSLSKRIQLMITFMLGTLVCVISIIRLVAVVTQNINDPSPTTEEVADYIWTTTEIYVAVISACLPTYRPFVTNTSGFFSRRYGSRSKITKGSSDSNSSHKASSSNSWPSNRVPSEASDSFVGDRSPLATYRAAVERAAEGRGSPNMRDAQYMHDIEMQWPAGAITVEHSWDTRWDGE